MKAVGITGGIGSGKSTLCHILAGWGVPVYDADTRTKALYDGDPELIPALEKVLGERLRREDGTLDRRRFAAVVFGDPEAMEQVEAIVHPKVLADFLAWKERLPETPWEGPGSVPFAAFESAIVLEKPLFAPYLDKVVWVEAPRGLRLGRTVLRDGSDESAVLARMARQQELSAKADAVLSNDADLGTLAVQARFLFEKLLTEHA